MAPATPPPRKMVNWDPTITLGHVITVVPLLLTMAGLWFRLETRVEMLTTRTAQLEAARREDDKETSIYLQRFATMAEAQRAMATAIERIERRLERMDPQPPPGPSRVPF